MLSLDAFSNSRCAENTYEFEYSMSQATQLNNPAYAPLTLRTDVFRPSSYMPSEINFIKINEDSSFCQNDDQNLFAICK